MDTGLILISESDDDLRAMASEALESSGFVVVGTACPSKGLELLAKGLRPDCALIDAGPDLQESLKIVESYRYLLSGRAISLILSSGRLDLNELAQQCRAKWVLPKPYELECLVKIVRDAVNNRKI